MILRKVKSQRKDRFKLRGNNRFKGRKRNKGFKGRKRSKGSTKYRIHKKTPGLTKKKTREREMSRNNKFQLNYRRFNPQFEKKARRDRKKQNKNE